MNIDRLDLLAYGHLTDVSLDLSAGPHRFHIIVGKNESGKSTSMRAIDAWLYGFAGQTSDDYVHPMKKLRVGGILREGDTTLHCIRRKGNRDTLLDGCDGVTAIEDQRLHALLAGVDQQTFGTQFLIDHVELVAGGRMILQGHGELGETLFAAGAGLGRLKKVQDDLRQAEEKLLKERGKSTITDALKNVKEGRQDLKDAQVPPAHYAELQKDLAEKQTELAELKQQSNSISANRSSLAARIDALPIIPAWQQATDDLSRVADAPVLPDDFPSRRRDLNESIAVNNSSLERLAKKRQDLVQQLEQVRNDTAVLSHQDEIARLTNQLPVREKGEVDRTGFMLDVLRGQERDLRQHLADLAKSSQTDVQETDSDDDDLSEQVRQFQLDGTQRNKVGRLATDYATVVANLDETKRQVDRFKKRIEPAATDLEKLPKGEDAASVTRAVDSVDSPTVLTTALREATAQRDRQLERCQSIVKRLAVDQPLRELVELRLPKPTQIAKASERIDQCDDDLQITKRQLDELRRQLADDEVDYEALEADTHLPSQMDLQEARQKRDAALARVHQRSPVMTDAHESDRIDGGLESADVDFDQLLQCVRQADQIVDQLRLHQKEVTQREAKLTGIRRTTAKIGQIQKQVSEQETNLQEAKLDWQALWTPLGVTAQSPEAMKDWCSEHEKLVQYAEQLGDFESKVVQSSQAIDLAIKQLARAVNGKAVNEDEPGGSDPIELLIDLHDRAKSMVDQRDTIERKRESLAQRISGWESDLSESESTLAARIQAMDDWQKQWDRATESLSSASPTPDDIVPMLDAIKDLGALKKDRDDMRHRRTSLTNETFAFLKDASRVLVSINGESSALKIDGDDSSILLQNAIPKIHAVIERSKQATIDATTRERLTADIKQLDDELGSENSTRERNKSLVNELCREAGSQDFDKLHEIETRSRERKALVDQVRAADLSLKVLAGGKTVEEFIHSIGDVQEGVLQDQLVEIDQRRDLLVARIEIVQRELGAVEQKLSQINGGASASEISQSLASQIDQIRDRAEEYIRLRLARGILRRAIEHYRNENQEPVLKIAEGYFRELTCGRYVGLNVDYDDKDTPVLFGVRQNHDDVPASGFSNGTADSLYLALRLASLAHRTEDGTPMPLIVDDCLQQLDDDRAAAAMKVFSKLSERTQVIMFTHHEHLVGLAESQLSKTEVHVHRLTMS